MKREWTLTNGLAADGSDEWHLEFFDVPRWRAFIARSTESVLHACFDVCCKWGPAYRLLSWAVNFEHKAQVLVARLDISEADARLLLSDDIWTLFDEDDE